MSRYVFSVFTLFAFGAAELAGCANQKSVGFTCKKPGSKPGTTGGEMVKCTAEDIATQLTGSAQLTTIDKSVCSVPREWTLGGVQGKEVAVQTGGATVPVFKVTLWTYAPDEGTTRWKLCSAKPGVESPYTDCFCA